MSSNYTSSIDFSRAPVVWKATLISNRKFEGNVWNRLVLLLKLIFVSKRILKFPSKKIVNYNWKHSSISTEVA